MDKDQQLISLKEMDELIKSQKERICVQAQITSASVKILVKENKH